MSHIEMQQLTIATVGEAGSVAGSGTTIPIEGFLLDVYLDYNAACPATADVTITDPIFGVVFTKSNNATDVRVAPREPVVGADGAATGLFDLIPINSALTIDVAEADELAACLVVTLRWLTP